MLGGYLGLLLLATSFVAVGVLTSSFTENDHRGVRRRSCRCCCSTSSPGRRKRHRLGAVLRYISLTEHFAEMVKGVIDTKDLVYFATS